MLDSIYGPEYVWEHLPQEVQQAVSSKHVRLFVINAHEVANRVGLKGRINTIMQTCFFASVVSFHARKRLPRSNRASKRPTEAGRGGGAKELPGRR